MSATAIEESKRNNRQFLPAQLYNLWYGLHTEILKSASGFRLFVVLNALCNNSSLLYNNSRHKTKEMFTGAFARSQVDLISDQIHLRSFLICLDIHFFTARILVVNLRHFRLTYFRQRGKQSRVSSSAKMFLTQASCSLGIVASTNSSSRYTRNIKMLSGCHTTRSQYNTLHTYICICICTLYRWFVRTA